MDKFKVVYLPIRVPRDSYCWDGHILCEHFEKEGGYSTCDMGFNPYRGNEEYYWLKDTHCILLTEKKKHETK